MNLAKKYMGGLKNKYLEYNNKDCIEGFNKFENTINGAEDLDIHTLLNTYPDTPKSLIDLLKIVDGTYHREYSDKIVIFCILGSNLIEYPYYLLSSKQIVETENDASRFLGDYINGEYNDAVEIDDKLIDSSEKMNWLHFSDCMNNGGTSQLFIDFSPSAKGTYGQIVMFLHDPDEITVIAESFDEYLEKLMQHNYDFASEEDFE